MKHWDRKEVAVVEDGLSTEGVKDAVIRTLRTASSP